MSKQRLTKKFKKSEVDENSLKTTPSMVFITSSIATWTGLWGKRALQYFHGKDYKYWDNNQFRDYVKQSAKVFDLTQTTLFDYK